jgi:signal transduction histidine kinase
MLHGFLDKNRDALISRCRSKVATRRAPRATEQDLHSGIPLFLDQLMSALQREPGMERAPGSSDIGRDAAQHANELLRRGFTVDEVVHDYGDLCQAITEVAIEQDATVSAAEFRTLNWCLDEAIASAVTEFGRRREECTSDELTHATNERLGFFAHELRNLINIAILAVATIRRGDVGLAGATGALLDRTLIGVRDLVDLTLGEVRLTAGLPERRERIAVADFIGDIRVATAIEAAARGLEFNVAPIDGGLAVEGDRQILAAAVTNLLQNAVKFTRPRGRVTLSASAAAHRVLISVEDECGGLPDGTAEEIFRPFEQRGAERTGLGLGLAMSRRGVEAHGGQIHVHNLPGRGCVFTIDLTRAATAGP